MYTQALPGSMAVQNAAIGKDRGGKKRGYDPQNDDKSRGMGGGESHNRSGKSENKSGEGGSKRHGKSGGKSHGKSGGKSHGKWSGPKARPTRSLADTHVRLSEVNIQHHWPPEQCIKIGFPWSLHKAVEHLPEIFLRDLQDIADRLGGGFKLKGRASMGCTRDGIDLYQLVLLGHGRKVMLKAIVAAMNRDGVSEEVREGRSRMCVPIQESFDDDDDVEVVRTPGDVTIPNIPQFLKQQFVFDCAGECEVFFQTPGILNGQYKPMTMVEWDFLTGFFRPYTAGHGRFL